MGWSNQVVIARLVIVEGTNDGLFVYASGTRPALGNPPIAWMNSGLADPFGNVLPSTTGVAASGTFQAGDTIIKALGEFLYSGTPAAGNLIASIASAAGANDGLSNPYKDGFTVYNGPANLQLHVNASFGAPAIELPAGLASEFAHPAIYNVGGNVGLVNEFENLQIIGPASTFDHNSASIALTGSAKDGSTIAAGELQLAGNQIATWLSNGLHVVKPLFGSGGVLTIGDQIARTASGLSGYPAITQVDTVTNQNSGAGTGPAQITKAWPIPANDAQVGTIYEIEVPFQGTLEGNAITWEISIDGSVTGLATTTMGGAFYPAGTSFDGTLRAKLMMIATGTGGQFHCFTDGGQGINGNRSSGTNNNNSYLSGLGFNQPLDTTVAHNMRVNVAFAGVTAGQFVQGYGSKFTRSGP